MLENRQRLEKVELLFYSRDRLETTDAEEKEHIPYIASFSKWIAGRKFTRDNKKKKII